ncbi:MAG: hypothetical protein JJE09_09745, partial [Bacteroidia bacterium]|nr:hypothetical protein [Bacteroidia bacterium]
MSTKNKLSIRPPKKSAGGLDAVIHSTKHIIKEVGIIEGVKVISRLNQFDGFDCPGCAWPDPDDKRSVVEFCENGVKAVAEEATSTTCDPDFFARHSISEMLSWTDFEIGKSGRVTHPMIVREGKDNYEPIA